VLSVPQIRYCAAEDIRLDAAKGVINNYVEAEVDRFNAMVADYNSRCSRFRYRRGALESARSDVEAIRSLLQAEGRSRFVRRPNLGSQQRPAEGASPSFDGVVLAIQRRLNALGYDAGVPDGFVGPKTRTAIVAFQKAEGLSADGMPTASLLARMNTMSSHRNESRTSAAIAPGRDTRVPEGSAPHREPGETQEPPPRSIASVPPPAATPPVPQVPSGKPDLTSVNSDEQQAIERTCDSARRYSPTRDYYACLTRELNKLGAYRGKPDMSRASADEQQAIERTCDSARRYSGPADYYACLTRELNKLGAYRGKPDMSRASADEQQAIERTCDSARRYSGPADYYACLTRELSKLTSLRGRPDLSRANSNEQRAIEQSCDSARRYSGPADYYSCLSREMAKLGYR
jgi:peptidoglycan hydrolase-like protein with peptidoglycan-binding domain